MDLVRSKFGTNEPLPVDRQQTGLKMRFICTEVTSYKIHTLTLLDLTSEQLVQGSVE